MEGSSRSRTGEGQGRDGRDQGRSGPNLTTGEGASDKKVLGQEGVSDKKDKNPFVSTTLGPQTEVREVTGG